MLFSLDFGALSAVLPGDANGATPDTTAGVSPDDRTEQDATPDVTPTTPNSQSGLADLTFAVKLDPQANPDTADPQQDRTEAQPIRTAGPIQPAAPQSATATPPVKDTRRSDLEEDAPQPAPRNEIVARVAAFQPPEKGAAAEAEPAAGQPHIETAKALETPSVQTASLESAAKPAAPLKELSIQVGQTQQDRVELRVVERSGELQVGVRAANPELAQGLRQGLPDLVDRLEQNGFHAETWRPGTPAGAVQTAGETRQRPMQSQPDTPQWQSGGQQQGRQQNRQNQSYRPQWVQELEGNLRGGQFAGELNGIAS